MNGSAIMCDEVIESSDKETNFNEKKQSLTPKISTFTCIFINYHCIIDSC